MISPGAGTYAFDIENFSLVEMLQCSRGLRNAAAVSTTVEEAANAVVRFLYNGFQDSSTGSPSCALVRFYLTRAYGALDVTLRDFVDRQLRDRRATTRMKCLTLVATIGDRPEWCDPRKSVAHRVIPLPSIAIVEQAPMIAQLIRQMGLEISAVVEPSLSMMPSLSGKTYNVFYVPEARGSAYIPAQADFVEPYGIRSVVGFGGIIHSGEFFAIVMFSRSPIAEEPARRFAHIALDVKSVMFPLLRGEVTE